MAELPSRESKPQRSVLAILGDRAALASTVLLSDSDSEHGHTPVLAPGSSVTRLVPQGRGNYQLHGEIARGGMGVILRAHDTDLGRDVAVKVLDGVLAKHPSVVQRFVEEAQISGQLQHPGIVPVYELGLMADERPYFTMKLVKGRTLAALFQLRSTPADDRGRLLSIFESVCQTVAYAHSKGVIHRDLKPANVMIGAFGEVQVVDWGLAKVLRRGGGADEQRDERRKDETVHVVIETGSSAPGSSGLESMAGSVMGTPPYMAPEQAQGEVEALDERADVFSLGAILCELLTGRPPYVAPAPDRIGGESVHMQAAFARLEPARAALAECSADAVLVQLCLQCLTPAKDVRPASAAVVANAVHAYLTTSEERARKAELAAAEARIRATEERRARRLTLALAATIVLALTLTGGGFYWAARERARSAEERAKRTELVRTDVEAAQGESTDFGRAGKHAEALASARRALSRAQSGEADATLVARARRFVETAENDLAAAERERKLVQQDEALRSRLVDLRVKRIATMGNGELEAALDAEFTQAFHDYGVDLEGDDVVPALERIRERRIGEDVAIALDEWGRLCRNVHGAKSEKAENLFVLAMDLDPEPRRRRMREAIAANDVAVMHELTSPENLPKLEPGSIFVLIAELWGNGAEDRWPEVFRILDQARRLYPSDFVLQAGSGFFYQAANEFELALACRNAALSLRPGNVAARYYAAESMATVGLLPEALAPLRQCLEAEPTSVEAADFLGIVQLRLGDDAGALTTLSSCPGVLADRGALADLRTAQFYRGALSREELERSIDKEYDPTVLATVLLALVEHPDPQQRDPRFVLHTLAERDTILGTPRWRTAIEVLAHARLEEWPEAIAVLEGPSAVNYRVLLMPMAYDFVAAFVFARAGREADARLAYKRGMDAWNDRTRYQPAAWEHSGVMRWRREAEAALAK